MNTQTTMTPLSAEIIKRAQAGDSDAFADLFNAHKARIYALCLRMTNNTAEAEDLTQDAFLQVFRKLSTFRGDSALSTWMHRIAVNTVLMFIRKRNSSIRECPLEPVFGSEEEAAFEGPVYGKVDDTLSMTTDRVALLRAIENLPPGYRLMIILHDIHGYEHQEIADIFGCTTGNTKSQLHKARLRLRSVIGAPHDEALNGSRKRSQRTPIGSGKVIEMAPELKHAA